MRQSGYFYTVEGQRLPLRKLDNVRFVTPAKHASASSVAARLSRSTRLGLDTSVRRDIVVRGDPAKLKVISSYPDVRSMRSAFVDANGLELVLTNNINVGFTTKSTESEREALCKRYGCSVVERDGLEWTIEVSDPSEDAPLDVANALDGEKIVEYAEPDALQRLQLMQTVPPSDVLFANQWHLNNTGQGGGTIGADVKALDAWLITRGEPGVRVVVHDSGVDVDHPDLAANIAGGRDFDNGDNNPDADADEPHGTACAGVIAAVQNGQGVVGIAPRCRIVPIRAADAHTWSTWAKTFQWAGAHGEVISCSWTISRNSRLTRAIRSVANNGRDGRGIPIFFATGNDGVEGIGYPASLSETIAVGASTNYDQRAGYSQYGTGLDFLAPSSGGSLRIETTDILGAGGYNGGAAGDYCNAGDGTGFGGTSSATPLAAGVAALMLSVNSTLTASQIRKIMRDTAEKIDAATANYNAAGWSNTHGYGRINAAAAVEAARAALPALTDGDFIVAWQDDRDQNGYYQVRARSFTATGQPTLPDFTVNTISSGQQRRPSIGAAPSGDFVVTWEDDKDQNNYYQIHARGFTRHVLERLPQFTVNTQSSGQQLDPAIAVGMDGRFVVAWADDQDNNGYYQIYARGFNADGSQLFPDMTVNPVSDGQQVAPSVGISPAGSFIVAWQDDRDGNGYWEIYARGFNPNGSQSFAEVLVNPVSSGQQRAPAIAVAADGSFVVAWEDDRDKNSYYEIYARGFNPNGSQKFGEILVNETSSGQQRRPAIAMAPDGRFVVAWSDDRDKNGYYQIYARAFTASGAEAVSEMVVNTVSSGQQREPSVAMARNGSFVVAWEDDRNENGYYEIYARGFNANGTEKFPELLVNSTSAGQQLAPTVTMVQKRAKAAVATVRPPGMLTVAKPAQTEAAKAQPAKASA